LFRISDFGFRICIEELPMVERWYYSHKGQTVGPVTTAEIKRRAAARLFKPGDLLWPASLDRSQAIEACMAIEIGAIDALADEPEPVNPVPNDLRPANAEPPKPGPAPLPNWLDDVKKAEGLRRRRPHRAKPSKPVRPSWLEDIRRLEGL
jgi:hypothetical protein